MRYRDLPGLGTHVNLASASKLAQTMPAGQRLLALYDGKAGIAGQGQLTLVISAMGCTDPSTSQLRFFVITRATAKEIINTPRQERDFDLTHSDRTPPRITGASRPRTIENLRPL